MTVSNTLSSVIPTLFAQGLQALRHNSVMARLVNADFGTEVKQKGETIQVPVPSVMAASDVVPGAFAPDPQNVAPSTAPIALDFWKEAPFTLSEKELAQVIEGVVPIQLSAAIEALATNVNSNILALYKGVYGYVGTAGTTPFASTLTAATSARKVLGNQLAPTGNRRVVLNPDAEANALGLPAFSQYLQSADPNVIREGDIGRKLGFDWYMDQQVPTQTAGTLTGAVTANGAQSAGAGAATVNGAPQGTVSIATPSGGAFAPNVGDIITFSGDIQTYSIISGSGLGASATGNFTISPALQVAKSGGETVTLAASHVVNLAFHRDAFAFASRPLMNMELTKSMDDEFVASDPVSKITMRLSYREEFHRTRFAFDILYGVGLIRPQLACRIAG
jgi:hypothetical protein